MAEPSYGPGTTPIEVVPLVVLSQSFPARPSSIPDIRDFVRRCLAESPLNEDGNREVGETVFRALLDAAGPTGSIHVAFRIFPEHIEVDVLHSEALPGQSQPKPVTAMPGADGRQAVVRPGSAASAPSAPLVSPVSPAPASMAQAGMAQAGMAQAGMASAPVSMAPAGTAPSGGLGEPATFAEWMSKALRREGMTQEAAARQLGVSVKTVSRWVGGTTEPRMRDLRRIQEVFGEVPLP